jgi:quercetin dioxygenase-like cupin family protein
MPTAQFSTEGTLTMSRSVPTATSQQVADEILDVIGPRIRHMTALSDAADDYCLIKADFPAGVVVPIHSHADRETFYILGGELEGLWEDRWVTLVAGDVFDVPGGVKHAWRNTSQAPVSLLILTSMRLGRFLRDIGRPAASVEPGPPKPADLERLSETAQTYGYWLGSPADNATVGISLF